MAETKSKKPRVSPSELPTVVSPLLNRPQVCSALGMMSVQAFDRMISAGQFPKADTRLGDKPVWLASTVNAWIAERCRKGA